MLISRIERSVDRILEGIDSGDVSLILEASQEFQDGYKKLMKTHGEFVSILKKYNDKKGFDGILKELVEIEKTIKSINVKDIPKDFSFKEFAALNGAEAKGSDQAATLTKVSSAFDSYYSGTKDAIIKIAEGLEPLKEIFSVGSKGIYLTQAFVTEGESVEKTLTFEDLASAATPEAFANLLATGDPNAQDKDEWKKKFEQTIKELIQGDKEGPSTEAIDAAENKFVEGLGKAKEALGTLFKNTVDGLLQTKPNPALEKAIKEKGFLQSLFAKDNPYKIDKPKAESIVKGLVSLPMEQMNLVIKDLVALSGNAEEAVEGAIKGVEAEADKSTEIPEATQKFIDKLTKWSEETLSQTEEKAKITAVSIIAFLTDSGLQDDKLLKDPPDLTGVDVKKFINKLNEAEIKEADAQSLLKLLKLEDASERGEDAPANVDNVVNDVLNQYKENPEKPDIKQLMNEIIDGWVESCSEGQQNTLNSKPENSDISFINLLKTEIQDATNQDDMNTRMEGWFNDYGAKEPLNDPDKSSPQEVGRIAKILDTVYKKAEDVWGESIGNETEEITPVDLPFKWNKNFKDGSKDIQAFAKKNGIEMNKDTAKFAFLAMKEEGLITLQESFGESKIAFKKEFLKKVQDLIDAGNMKPNNKDALKKEFDDNMLDVIWLYFKGKGVQLNESYLFNRWGVLAGIIKG